MLEVLDHTYRYNLASDQTQQLKDVQFAQVLPVDRALQEQIDKEHVVHAEVVEDALRCRVLRQLEAVVCQADEHAQLVDQERGLHGIHVFCLVKVKGASEENEGKDPVPDLQDDVRGHHSTVSFET